MRSWADFAFIELCTLPMFLFSATFVPADTYPDVVRWLLPLTPLYHGVELLRAFTLGDVTWLVLVDIAYLVGLDGRVPRTSRTGGSRSCCSSSYESAYWRKRWLPCARADRRRAGCTCSGRSATPSTSPKGADGGRPASSGDTVRNSSSTRPASTSEPKTCGPASLRMRRWPRPRRSSTADRDVDLGVARQRDDLDAGGKRARQALGAGVRRHDERRILEHRAVRRDRPRGGEDRDTRPRLETELATELGVRLRGGREHRVGPPPPARRRAQRPAADQDDVRRSAQEPHHEAVGLAAARDQPVRVGNRRDRHDAVDGLHEVGVDAALGQREVAAVHAAQLRRQRETGRGLRREQRERLEARSSGEVEELAPQLGVAIDATPRGRRRA